MGEEGQSGREQPSFGIDLVGVVNGSCCLSHPGEQPLTCELDVREVEPLLRAEVVVDHRLRDSSVLGDLVHGGFVKAVGGEHASSDLEHLSLSHRAGELAAPPLRVL